MTSAAVSSHAVQPSDTAPLRVRAVSFDFGNTLVRVDRAGLRSVVATVAARLLERGVIRDEATFLTAWSEERDRQFREEVPAFREVDLDRRVVRVLARLRGAAAPPESGRWDDVAAARLAADDEVGFTLDVYADVFAALMQPAPDAAGVLGRLKARGFRLGILSNWPLAAAIDRYAVVAGWSGWLDAVVVSQRVGIIKPHRAIFDAAARALGASPDKILHVGDDWAADVVGASAAGWRVAYLRDSQGDSPLPTSIPDGVVTPDLVLGSLSEVESKIAVQAG